jgi:hypothetical protein
LNPFSTAAMDQTNSITDAARGAQPYTALADAKISIGGITAGLRDTRDYYNRDIKFIIVATIIIVLLILMGLLRAIVAPLYLIGSVLISYASALGIGVIVFQFLLGQELHWSVPGLTFILLVAVGADYNLLLISRIRDESPHGVRIGVIRTVGSTGAVITSAGLIFAASMFGLTLASITTMAEIGFVIGIGILIDTFLVRTITVPAVAALVGQANWWPSRLEPRTSAIKPARVVPTADSQSQLLAAAEKQAQDVLTATTPAEEVPTPHDHEIKSKTVVPPQVPQHGRHRNFNVRHAGNQLRDVSPAPGIRNGQKLGITPAVDLSLNDGPAINLEDAKTPTAAYDGQHPSETHGRHRLGTNGQHPPETNGHVPVKTPTVESSPEDDRADEPRWIGRWAVTAATFPAEY